MEQTRPLTEFVVGAPAFSIVFPHNIHVVGLLFFVPANATAEKYENGFPQRPLPPERIEIIVIVVPLLISFYTEM